MTVLLEGNIAHVSLFNLLQFVRLEQRDCHFHVEIREIGQEADLYFQRGTLIYAALNQLIGEDAMYRLICWWNAGHFQMRDVLQENLPEPNIQANLDGILMESARYMDEHAPLREKLPSLSSSLSFSNAAMPLVENGQLPEFTRQLPRSFTVARFFENSPFNQWDSCEFLKEMIERGMLLTSDGEAEELGSTPTSIDSLLSIMMEFAGIDDSRRFMTEVLEELHYNREQAFGFAQLLSIADKLMVRLSPLLKDEELIQEATYRLRARITSLL